MSMPPYRRCGCAGRDDIGGWMLGPGCGCRGSRLVPTVANGCPAFGAVPAERRTAGYEPWALQVLEIVRRADRRRQLVPRHRDALPAVRPAGAAGARAPSAAAAAAGAAGKKRVAGQEGTAQENAGHRTPRRSTPGSRPPDGSAEPAQRRQQVRAGARHPGRVAVRTRSARSCTISRSRPRSGRAWRGDGPVGFEPARVGDLDDCRSRSTGRSPRALPRRRRSSSGRHGDRALDAALPDADPAASSPAASTRSNTRVLGQVLRGAPARTKPACRCAAGVREGEHVGDGGLRPRAGGDGSPLFAARRRSVARRLRTGHVGGSPRRRARRRDAACRRGTDHRHRPPRSSGRAFGQRLGAAAQGVQDPGQGAVT